MHKHASIPITQQLLLQRFELLKQQAALSAQKGAALKGPTRPPQAPRNASPFARQFVCLHFTTQQWLVLAAGGALILWHAHYLYIKQQDKGLRSVVLNRKIEQLKALTIQRIQQSEALSGEHQIEASLPAK